MRHNWNTETPRGSPRLSPLFNAAWRLRVLLLISLIWAAPALACGSFAPRPTPTPTTPPVVANGATGGAADDQTGDQVPPTPIPDAPADTPTPEPTATFTPTPVPGTALGVGLPARVTAPAGLNLRDIASPSGRLVIQLGTGVLVNIVEGPTEAEGYTWWKVDDRLGNSGWAAEGDDETVWLSPQVGEPQAVSRAPRVGDRVVVSTNPGQQLSIRALPGTDGPLVTRADPRSQFTVVAGPQSANGFTWYQIRSDDGGVEGWAADGDATTRWLSPLE